MKVLVVLASSVAGAMVAVATICTFVFLGPYFWYVLRSPSPEGECTKIRSGMDMNEVLAVADATTPPFNEGYTPDMLIVSRNGTTTCQMQFEKGTTVSQVRLVKNAEVVE